MRNARNGWREVDTLKDMLAFVARKHIVKPATKSYSPEGLGVFSDGSAILCRAEERGFRGSEETPADPPEVVFYVTDKYEGRMP